MRRSVIAKVVRAFALILTLCSAIGASSLAQAQSQPKLLVLGDSLSAEYGLKRGSGWVNLMQQKMSAEKLSFEVINASISGETTSGGRTRLPALLQKHKPQVVIIELGANDALRGLDLASTEANLAFMTQASKNAGASVLLVGMLMPPNYGKQYSQSFSSLFSRVAKQANVALVPFFLEGFGEDLRWFQADRIHPTEQAQPLMLENLWPTLKPLLAAKKRA